MMRTHKQGLMSRRRRWVLTLAWLLAILTISISAWAQGRSADPPQGERRGYPGRGGRGGGPRDEPPPFADPNFLAAEMRFGGKTVKGAPYTAEAVTEFTQTLGNGTRISRRSTTLFYRDNEGRTRQEGTFGPAGPFASGGEAPSLVFINDPVARTQYLLNPRDRTATKMSAPGGGRPPFSPPSSGPSPGAPPPGRPESPDRHLSSGKQEALGKQMIEGVEAEGTRFTYTIPAGQIGNDRPIEVVSESWYSPVLQRVVLSKHSDPRFGESISRLININQAEPARALFEVPADYKLTKNDPHREPNREWNERKK